MTDTATAARRALLGLLVTRVEEEALLGAETPLLRPLVDAETLHGQAMIDQFTADAPWLKAAQEDQLDVVRTAVAEAIMCDDAACLARTHLPKIAELLGGVPLLSSHKPAPDGTAAGGLHTLNTDGGWIWQCRTCGAQSGEHYTGEDIAREYALAKHPFCLSSVRAPEPVFCSPLVTTNCPGHAGPPYCERAAASPVPVFEITCQRCGEPVQVPGDVTLYGDGTIPGHTCSPSRTVPFDADAEAEREGAQLDLTREAQQ